MVVSTPKHHPPGVKPDEELRDVGARAVVSQSQARQGEAKKAKKKKKKGKQDGRARGAREQTCRRALAASSSSILVCGGSVGAADPKFRFGGPTTNSTVRGSTAFEPGGLRRKELERQQTQQAR